MFYSQLFVSKRGTLAKIWLAAHWEKKITKAHVFECDLEASIRDILCPQIKIGLRTSGHLLLGVVRIYSKKTRYLLTDCSDALVKIKVAFRPGQTDLPYDGLEATLKTITLPEDFTDFDTQLPDLNTIDVADHFSLNQCRTEDITLKENFVNHFLSMEGIGEEIQSYQGMFDQSFSVQGDCFGDEEMAVDLIDFIASNNEDALMPGFYKDSPELPATPPPTAVSADEPESVKQERSCSKGRSSPDMTETTFLVNAEEGFALAPVAVTPSPTRKRVTRKRKLVIDRSKEISDDAIRDQLADYSDLLTPLEIAPPTQQLMEWRASGGVKQLFSSFCLPLFHPDLKQLFPCDMPPRRQGLKGGARQQADPEVMRGQTRDSAWEKTAVPGLEDWSLLQESVVPDQTEDANTTVIHPDAPLRWNITSEEESRLEVSYPEPVSDFSMFDHPSVETRKTPLGTQSALNSQDVEDKRLTSRANNLLQALKAQDSSPSAVYSLHALCEGSSRSYVAAVFFCLLVLRKQQILELHQSVPYSDITATPGPRFPFL